MKSSKYSSIQKRWKPTWTFIRHVRNQRLTNVRKTPVAVRLNFYRDGLRRSSPFWHLVTAHLDGVTITNMKTDLILKHVEIPIRIHTHSHEPMNAAECTRLGDRTIPWEKTVAKIRTCTIPTRTSAVKMDLLRFRANKFIWMFTKLDWTWGDQRTIFYHPWALCQVGNSWYLCSRYLRS